MTYNWKVPWSGRSHDYTEEEIQLVVDVMRSGDPLTQGKYLSLFENKLAGYLKVPQGKIFALNSATSALELIAGMLHLEESQEVIVPAHTFTASALPFLRRKASIVWADIDPETWTIDLADVERKLSPKTRGIVLVHLYGVPVDINGFLELASRKNIVIIEDVAQAFGGEYQGQKLGTFADFSAFSFHGQKNMTTLGEGGALFVKDSNLVDKVPGLRSFGSKPFGKRDFYWKPAMSNLDSFMDWELPNKFTITEVQCAVGYKLLDRIDTLNKEKGRRYWNFRAALSSFPELRFQKILPKDTAAYHLMPAKYEGSKHGIQAQRDDLIQILSSEYGIQAIVQYCPLYRYDLYKKWGCGNANCPNTDDFFDNMLSFPFHLWMSDEQFDYMTESTIKALIRLRKRDKK